MSDTVESEDIKVQIDGEAAPVVVPQLKTFADLKRAWPSIKEWDKAVDYVEKVSVAVRIVSAALSQVRPDLNGSVIDKRMTSREHTDSVLMGAVRLVTECGLLPKGQSPGEAPAATPSPSTETSTA